MTKTVKGNEIDLTKPSEIRALAARHGITLTRLRGQHFLIEKGTLVSVADSADLKKTDTVLEVGPGFGTLTRELAARAGRVVAVELDRRFLPVLDETVGGFSNVRIISGDVLRLPTTHYALPTNYKIVSNLPYGITGDFLWKTMTEWDPPPKALVLMLQREVGERLIAKPPRLPAGRHGMNLLAVMAQSFGTVEIIRRVSRGSFWPPPKVESAIVRIIRHQKPLVGRQDVLRLAKIGFSSPRKKIGGTLGRGMLKVLKRTGIDPNARPEVLTIEAWQTLASGLWPEVPI